MAKKNIGIRNATPIGVSDIDVYNTNKRKFDNFPPAYGEKVRLRIGVFFDGTGNNSYNSDAVYYKKRPLPIDIEEMERDFKEGRPITYKGMEITGDASYLNRYSNVKLLFDLYEPKNLNYTTDRKDPHHQVQLKIYVEGIGTLRDALDDTLGTAFGEGDRGVIGRAEQACTQIADQIVDSFNTIKSKQGNNKKKSLFIDTLQFDVFGFSRGAAAARHFVNEVLKQKDIYTNMRFKPEQQPVKSDKISRELYHVAIDKTYVKTNDFLFTGKDFTGGKLGEGLKTRKIAYPKKEVTVEFLGLFDTVISQFLEKKGIIDVARSWPSIPIPAPFIPILSTAGQIGLKKVGQIPKVNPDISHPSIKKVFHIVAANEWRENFSITPIGKVTAGGTIKVFGAHSNIGGCYWSIKTEINTLHFFDMPVDDDTDQINRAELFKINLRKWYIDNNFCEDFPEVIYWETKHHVKVYDLSNYNGPNIYLYETKLIAESVLGTLPEKVIDNKLYVLTGYHYSLKSRRKLNNKLSLVYLNTMKYMAVKFGEVPFTIDPSATAHPAEYTFDENYKLDETNFGKESYQDIINRASEHGWMGKDGKLIEHKDLVTKQGNIQTYQVPFLMIQDIKLHFVYLSANFNSPLKNFLSEYQAAYPHAPNLTFENDYKDPPYQRESYTPVLDKSDK